MAGLESPVYTIKTQVKDGEDAIALIVMDIFNESDLEKYHNLLIKRMKDADKHYTYVCTYIPSPFVNAD